MVFQCWRCWERSVHIYISVWMLRMFLFIGFSMLKILRKKGSYLTSVSSWNEWTLKWVYPTINAIYMILINYEVSDSINCFYLKPSHDDVVIINGEVNVLYRSKLQIMIPRKPLEAAIWNWYTLQFHSTPVSSSWWTIRYHEKNQLYDCTRHEKDLGLIIGSIVLLSWTTPS